MEIVEAAEAFTDDGDELEFAHTKIILRQKERYYAAVTTERRKNALQLDLSKLDIKSIPDTAIWPSAPEGLTIAPTPLPQDCFVKSPSLLDFGDTETSNFGDLILHEALTYEILEKTPHTNVGRYFGCVVLDGKIKAICLRKYDMTLARYLRERRGAGSNEDCWMQVKKGVDHLHRLGFIHCDLNPNNIMMNYDTPVILDFDSCRREGEQLGAKGGTIGWVSGDFDVAERKIDQQSLEKLRRLMCA